MKITALSSHCVDFFPEQNNIYVGGNSLNFATHCKLSGVSEITVIGAVGNDRFGTLIEEHFDKYNISRTHIYRMDCPTASNKIYINEKGDRYFKSDSWNGGAFDAFRLSGKDWKVVKTSDIVAMPAGDPNLIALLEKRSSQQIVVIDFLDYHSLEYIESFIDKIDITFLSAREEMLDDLEGLSFKSGKMIVATLGANGSLAFYENKRYYQEAYKVETIVDTTGCGDAFQAAFVVEWYKTRNIKSALFRGAATASKVLMFFGGVE
jgi:fructoselysine 6-kinase